MGVVTLRLGQMLKLHIVETREHENRNRRYLNRLLPCTFELFKRAWSCSTILNILHWWCKNPVAHGSSRDFRLKISAVRQCDILSVEQRISIVVDIVVFSINYCKRAEIFPEWFSVTACCYLLARRSTGTSVYTALTTRQIACEVEKQ